MQHETDLHIPILSIWGGRKRCVIEPTSFLSIRNDSIAFFTTSPKVILLKVASNFGKAISRIRCVASVTP